MSNTPTPKWAMEAAERIADHMDSVHGFGLNSEGIASFARIIAASRAEVDKAVEDVVQSLEQYIAIDDGLIDDTIARDARAALAALARLREVQG